MSKVRVIKIRFNVGYIPFLAKESNSIGLRNVICREDEWIEKFPLIWSANRLNDALEMNLFLEHRYKGIFMVSKSSRNLNSLGGVTIKTLYSLANSLSIFLTWLDAVNADWRDVTAVATTQTAKYWLPVYRFRKYLIDRVKIKEISRDTANLYMGHIRQFYEWASRRGNLDKLPFEYRHIKIRRESNNDVNLLFSELENSTKFIIQTSDLVIPKKYRQKSLASDRLSPYTKEEINHLYTSDYMSYPTRKLWVEIALLTGLRAFEIAEFSECHVVNPSNEETSAYYSLITGKGGKERQILLPRILMEKLWIYKNSKVRLGRISKWDMIYGTNTIRPLFLNRSGLFISERSISNITNIVKHELAKNSIVFHRSFHDLRSTYATNLAKLMLDKGLENGFIEFKLMSLLGHSNFSTTRKYLNFARSITFDNEMEGWTNKIFDGIEERLIKELYHLKENGVTTNAIMSHSTS